MTSRFTDWIDKASQLETAIASRVENTPRPPATSARDPLEILHAVLDAIGGEVLAAGRGRSVFPFTEVRVALLAPTPRDHARLSAAFDGPPSFEARTRERLAQSKCAVASLTVHLEFVAARAAGWTQPDFHVDYVRDRPAPVSTPPASEAPAVVKLELTVTHGSAERETYVFGGTALGSIAIGRGHEVRDGRDRLLRTNLVAFADAGEINQTVSRRHARIEHDARSGTLRLHDDTGGDRTSLVRGGRGLQIPRGRGLTLVSGDVIVLGRARLSVLLS